MVGRDIADCVDEQILDTCSKLSSTWAYGQKAMGRHREHHDDEETAATSVVAGNVTATSRTKRRRPRVLRRRLAPSRSSSTRSEATCRCGLCVHGAFTLAQPERGVIAAACVPIWYPRPQLELAGSVGGAEELRWLACELMPRRVGQERVVHELVRRTQEFQSLTLSHTLLSTAGAKYKLMRALS